MKFTQNENEKEMETDEISYEEWKQKTGVDIFFKFFKLLFLLSMTVFFAVKLGRIIVKTEEYTKHEFVEYFEFYVDFDEQPNFIFETI